MGRSEPRVPIAAGLPPPQDLLELAAAAGPWVAVVSLRTARSPAALVEACRTTLDGDQRRRASRFLFPEGRRDFILAHWLTNSLLSLVLGEPAVVRAPAGQKPRLADPGTLDFNLTHTPGLIACAIGRGLSVGIDAEAIRDGSWDAAQRYSLSQPERSWLKARPAAAAGRSFLSIWTLKEAVAKCLGAGLALDFRRFTVRPNPARLACVPEELGRASDWTLMQWEPDPDHVVALALKGAAPSRPRVRIWHARENSAPAIDRWHGLERQRPTLAEISLQRCAR